jgi:kynurenine formamidase
VDTADTEDRRVQFDFEIDFSNGGGIQGQGFRLDIDGTGITDEELAAYIVSDLRLLMVGEVRILNKHVIRERHKRAAGADNADATDDGRLRIDLSHVVERTDLCANTGLYREGVDLAGLSLDRLADLDGVSVNVTGSPGRAIDRTHLLPYDVHGRAVLIHTGWDRHWRTDHYFEGHPFLTEDAATDLRARGARLVGIDSLNIDDTPRGGERPVHSTLLGAGIPICEHLTNLAALPTEGFRFSAVPVKVKGMGTFPVRAFAVVDPPGGRRAP